MADPPLGRADLEKKSPADLEISMSVQLQAKLKVGRRRQC